MCELDTYISLLISIMLEHVIGSVTGLLTCRDTDEVGIKYQKSMEELAGAASTPFNTQISASLTRKSFDIHFQYSIAVMALALECDVRKESSTLTQQTAARRPPDQHLPPAVQLIYNRVEPPLRSGQKPLHDSR